MSKKQSISEEDLAVFYTAVKGSKRLMDNKIRIKRNNHKTIPSPIDRPIARKTADEEALFNDQLNLTPPVQGEDFICYKHVSIATKIIRKLQKGQYNIDAKLDLHNMMANQAQIIVNQFLHAALARQYKVLLIVHGKGFRSQQAPILKNKLNQWLRQIPQVLAFCSAQPKHGGRGAVYVLLKKQSGDN